MTSHTGSSASSRPSTSTTSGQAEDRREGARGSGRGRPPRALGRFAIRFRCKRPLGPRPSLPAEPMLSAEGQGTRNARSSRPSSGRQVQNSCFPSGCRRPGSAVALLASPSPRGRHHHRQPGGGRRARGRALGQAGRLRRGARARARSGSSPPPFSPRRLAGRAQRGVARVRWARPVEVSRRRLYRAASLGYLGNTFNGQFGLAVRIAALRRSAPGIARHPPS